MKRSVQGKYGTCSDTHTTERICRVVPTEDHDGNAHRRDERAPESGDSGLGQARCYEKDSSSQRRHRGHRSRGIGESRATFEMAADKGLSHQLHRQNRTHRSNHTGHGPCPVSAQHPHDTQRGHTNCQDRHRAQVSEVSGPPRRQMGRKDPEADGVHPIWPRPVDEGEPCESRTAQQEAAQKELHDGIGPMVGALRRFRARTSLDRHDHLDQITACMASVVLAQVADSTAERQTLSSGAAGVTRESDTSPSSSIRFSVFGGRTGGDQ